MPEKTDDTVDSMIQNESVESMAHKLIGEPGNQRVLAYKALMKLGRSAHRAFPVVWDFLIEMPADDRLNIDRHCRVLCALIDPADAADSFILLSRRDEVDSLKKALIGLATLRESAVLADSQASHVFQLAADNWTHPDQDIRQAACSCLRHWSDSHFDSAIFMLCEMLYDESNDVQMDAAAGLNSYGRQAANAVPKILASIDPDAKGFISYYKAREAILMDEVLFNLADRLQRKYEFCWVEEQEQAELVAELEEIEKQFGTDTAYAIQLLTVNMRGSW